ncbi:PKD domain-containing protein [Candidatus Woesearchaeota archaeon]|nr:PKD domain-containing protein [Candidatus Woesearchaeota archaeon]
MIIFLLVLSGTSFADICEVSRAKDILRKNLYLYLTNPSSSPLTINEVRDLLTFYLSIGPGLTTVDCSAVGSNSNSPISTIVNNGENAPNIIPACPDGTKYGECSSAKPKYCYGGSLVHKCNSCGCPSGNSCNSVSNNCDPVAENITCFSNLDCGNSQFTGSYYCSNYSITKNYLNYICISPGTASSSCVFSTNAVTLSYCDPNLNQTCVNGYPSCQTTVTNVTTACSDGTQYSQCSVTKPLYCSNGTLINNCFLCGCLSNLTCSSNETCVTLTNQNPVAIINHTLGINLSVRFNGSLSYDLDGFIASYDWDFGDGVQSNLTNMMHTYSSSGFYLVNLTVEDNLAAANTASKFINVT